MKSLNVMFDSLSNNTGDIAIGLATKYLLAKRQIQSININPYHQDEPGIKVIGGGELLRPLGDEFYDLFRAKGQNILNAVGVNYDSNKLDYLNEYQFVSARTSPEAEILSKYVRDVQVIPCATTKWAHDISKSVTPKRNENAIGIHLVPHSYRIIENLIPIIKNLSQEKIFFSFTPYNGDFQFMKALFGEDSSARFVRVDTPEDAVQLIGTCGSVITTSLHASIFSYAQEIPFISIKQRKVFDYFADRSLAHLVVENEEQLRAGIDHMLSSTKVEYARLSPDLQMIDDTFDTYAEYAFDSKKISDITFSFRDSTEAIELHQRQFQQVITDHDAALVYAEARRSEARESEQNWKEHYLKIRNLLPVKIAFWFRNLMKK